jgi:rhomboid protease GluP
MAAMMFVFGFIMPGIDNYAHAGGFLGGYLAGRLLDPLKAEQINHIAIAVGCLVLTVLAIIASLLQPYSSYRY